MTQICSYCKKECETVMESGEFDAPSLEPSGRIIQGNMGDMTVSLCCKEDTIDIDSEFWEWWTELNELAKQHDLLWVIGEDPEDRLHHDAFEEGTSAEDWLYEVCRDATP